MWESSDRDQPPDRVQSKNTVTCGVRAAMNSTQLQPGSRPKVRGVDDDSFRIFIETVRDYALLMLDPTGRIISWNAGAEAIKGYKADEIIGRHFSTFYPPESIDSGLPARELVVAARDGRFEDEGWRVRKDGTRFWANVVITALHSPDGTLIGYAKVTRDLTERRRHEEALRNNEAAVSHAGRRRPRLRHLHARPERRGRHLERRCAADHGLRCARRHRYAFLALLRAPMAPSGNAPTVSCTSPPAKAASRTKAGACARTARASGPTCSSPPSATPAGTLIGFSKITRDLTERRRHEAALLRERGALSPAGRERGRLRHHHARRGRYDHQLEQRRGAHQRLTAPAKSSAGISRASIRPKTSRANKPWRQLAAARERGRVNDEAWRIRKDGTQYWANNVIATPARDTNRTAARITW